MQVLFNFFYREEDLMYRQDNKVFGKGEMKVEGQILQYVNIVRFVWKMVYWFW